VVDRAVVFGFKEAVSVIVELFDPLVTLDVSHDWLLLTVQATLEEISKVAVLFAGEEIFNEAVETVRVKEPADAAG